MFTMVEGGRLWIWTSNTILGHRQVAAKTRHLQISILFEFLYNFIYHRDINLTSFQGWTELL